MIYTTGTIAGNGSTITGTGTNFTAAGSLIRVGCTLIAFTNPVQVLQLTAVTSGNALSVTPAVSPAIAAGTRFAILLSDSLSVDGLAQDIAETFGMYQKYMSGFADVMNGSTDVTITINGQQVTVPGQRSLAKKGANSDITSLSGLTTALSRSQGGTGLISPFGADANTFCQGNDSRLNTVNGKSGGTITGDTFISSPLGASPVLALQDGAGRVVANSNVDDTTSGKRRIFRLTGSDHLVFMEIAGAVRCRAGSDAIGGNPNNGFNINWTNTAAQLWIDSSNIGNISVTPTSDALLKTDMHYETDLAKALDEVLHWAPAYYRYIPRGIIPASDEKLGFIANDLVEVSPECVSGKGLKEGYDLLNPVDAYQLEPVAMIAKLTLALQALESRLSLLEAEKA